MVDRSGMPVRKLTRKALREDDEFVEATMEERVAMMWRIFQDSIPFLPPEERAIAQSRLSRHVVRVVRR